MADTTVNLIIRGKDEASNVLSDISGNVGGMGAALGTVGAVAAGAAVAAVGAVGVAAFNMSNQVDTAAANIQAALGTTADEAAALADVAVDVWGNNFAGSIEEAAGAVGIVRQQLGALADGELQQATESAFALSDVFGVDVQSSVDAAKTLMDNFGMSSEEAFDFIATGFQSGLDRSGDFLDTIGEYSTQFANGGADASQFFSLMESGLQGGMLGTDRAADAFKEFRVRIQDGSDLTAEALEAIGFNATEMADLFADGSIDAAGAFELVLEALNDVDDENLRMQAGVALLGTQFEDLGTDAALGLSLVGTSMGDMAGATDSLNAKYDTLGSAAEGYKRRALLSLQPIGDVLLGLANDAMPLVDQAFALFGTHIAPAIETAASVIQGFFNNMGEGMGVMDAFIEAIWDIAPEPVLTALVGFRDDILPGISVAISSVVGPVIEVVGSFVGWQDVLGALGIAIAAVVIPAIGSVVVAIAPVIAVFAAVVGAVALVRTAWEQNWGGIQEKTSAVMTFVSDLISSGLAAIQEFWTTHGDTIMETAAAAWDAIQLGIETVIGVVQDVLGLFRLAAEGDWYAFGETLRTMTDTVWETIKGTIETAVENIKSFFTDTDWGAVGSAIVTGIANGLTAAAGAIADAARSAANAALEAAKGFLGIESPSTVAAAQIGVPFAEGVALGAEVGMGDAGVRIQRSLNANLVQGTAVPPTLPTSRPAQPAQVNHYYQVTINDTRAMALFLDYLESIGGQAALESM